MAKMKKLLFIDIGGVLLTNGWDRHARALAVKQFGLDGVELENRHHLTFDTFEIGKLSLEDYLNRIVFYEKRPFTKEQFTEFMLEQSRPFPEMIQLVKGLKQKYGLKVVVISNEGREFNEYRIKKFKLNEIIDFYISSSFVHLRKPDLEIYQMALDLVQVDPKQTLYIEDRQLFVEVAEQLGIEGIHHVDYETTKLKLATFFL